MSTHNRLVAGSSPAGPTFIKPALIRFRAGFFVLCTKMWLLLLSSKTSKLDSSFPYKIAWLYKKGYLNCNTIGLMAMT